MPQLKSSNVRCMRVSRWGDRWVGHGRGEAYAIDFERCLCERAKHPELDLVSDFAGGAQRYLLGSLNARWTLLRDDGSRWTSLDLPSDLWTSASGISLAASDGQVVISHWRSDSGVRFHVSSRRGWRTWQAPEWTMMMRPARHMLFHRGRWLFGLSNEEHGGALFSLSENGLEEIELGRMAITGLEPDGDRVYVTSGVAFQGERKGELWCLEPNAPPELLTSTEVKRVMFDWPTVPDALMGLAVDSQRRIHLLLDIGGVVRLDGDTFVPLTPGFPSYASWGLTLMDDQTALICQWQAGVLRWKLGTEEFVQLCEEKRPF